MATTEVVPVKTEAAAKSDVPAKPAAWDPFTAIRRMSDEMDRLFLGFGHRRYTLPELWRRPELGAGDWAPDVEVLERKGELVVRADLPGMSPEDVKVEISDGTLSIEGERKYEKEEKKEGFYRSERAYGRFSRAIALPEGVAVDKAAAAFKNGVLEVTMPAPKAVEPEKRRLDVKVS